MLNNNKGSTFGKKNDRGETINKKAKDRYNASTRT